MRILHVTFSLLTGGKENILVDIANQQCKDGHTTGLLIVNNKWHKNVLSELLPGVLVRKIDRESGSRSPFWMLRIFLFINFIFKPDVIHCHDVALGKLLRLLTGKKRVITVHGLGADINALRHYKKVFAISEAVYSDLHARGFSNAFTIQNGIVCDNVRKKTGNDPQGSFRLVQVGNLLHDFKGQDLLIEAVEKVIRMQGRKITLHFIGEGPSRPFLEQLVDKYKLQDSIFFCGMKSRKEIYQQLGDYDLLVQPSRNEAFGLTIIESMAAGVPVLASDINGPAEIISRSDIGFLFKNGDPDDLAEKITFLADNYTTDPVVDKIKRAQKEVAGHYDIKITASQYVDQY